MNQDEGFHKRWELRSSNADEDSSSDDEGSGAPSNKMVTDLVLFKKDEADDDDPRNHSHGDQKLHIHTGIVRVEEKKLTSIKRKKVAKKKPEGKRKRKQSFKEEVMLKDLKIFADSLVRDLAAAQESMFARMRDEMRELVASESVKKNVRGLGKKVCAKIGTSKLEKQRNSVSLINGHIPFMDNNHSPSSRAEFCKLMAAKSLSRKFAELKQQELFGGFPLDYHKTWGGESRSSVAGVGLPAPLGQGMVNGSSMSSLSFLAEKGMLVSRFPSTTVRAPPSELMVANSITSRVSRLSEAEFQLGLKETK